MSKKLDFKEKQKLVEEASKGEYILLSDGDTVQSKVS